MDDARCREVALTAELHRRQAEIEMLRAQLREQAVRDPLTGLHNRTHLFESAPALLALARRQDKPLGVVIVDLDDFRQLNEDHGHAAGDHVLRGYAALLTRTLRESDIICRWSGQQFALVLAEVDVEGAYLLLARLLDVYLGEPIEHAGRRLPPASFSAGLAMFPSHGENLTALLQRADLALYAAKGAGRARIEIASRLGSGAMN